MIVACSSDWHGTIPNPPPANADLIIISGDILGHNPRGHGVGNASDFEFQIDQLFNVIVPTLKGYNKPVYFIGGNHDLALDINITGKLWRHKKCKVVPELRSQLTGSGVHYLYNEGFDFDGLKGWGSPKVPYIKSEHNWAFQFSQFDFGQVAKHTWGQIPDDVDILITHTPPAGNLDGDGFIAHRGCDFLAKELNYRIKPKLHAFGHCHDGRGICDKFDTKFVNGCISGSASDTVVSATGNPYNIQCLDYITVEL